MALQKAKWIENIWRQEVPTGTVNGVNDEFTLATVPTYASSLQVFLNGLIQRQGVDYGIIGDTITFTDAPALGQRVYAIYIA
jgi:hypothetical protein